MKPDWSCSEYKVLIYMFYMCNDIDRIDKGMFVYFQINWRCSMGGRWFYAVFSTKGITLVFPVFLGSLFVWVGATSASRGLLSWRVNKAFVLPLSCLH